MRTLGRTLEEFFARPLRYVLLTALPQAPVLVLVAVLAGSSAGYPLESILADWRGGLLGLLGRALLAYAIFCLASLAFVAGTAAVAVSLTLRLAASTPSLLLPAEEGHVPPPLPQGEGRGEGLLDQQLAPGSRAAHHTPATAVEAQDVHVWRIVRRRLWPLAGSMVIGCLVVLALISLLCVLFFGPLFLYAAVVEGQSGAQYVFDWITYLQAWVATPETRLYLAGVMLLVTVYLFRILVKWVLAPQVAALEGGTPDQVLARSRDTVAGVYWRTLGLLLALLVTQSILSGLLSGLVSTVARLLLPESVETLAVGAIGIACNLLFLPLPALGTTLLYLDLRQRKESLTPDRLAADLRAAGV